MKEEFLNLNSSLIQDKKRKEEKYKKNEITKEREWVGKIDKDLEIDRKNAEIYRVI